MDGLSFKINFFGNKHRIFIERNVELLFNSKREAQIYVRKYKKTVHDNVIMLNYMKSNMVNLATLYYQFFDFRTKVSWNAKVADFDGEFLQIYHNRGGDNHSYVQWNKIMVCFNCLEDMIYIAKGYAQRNKKPELLHQLYPIEKFYDLLYGTYRRDIKGLFVYNGHRTKVIDLIDTRNGIQNKEMAKRTTK